MTSTPPVRLPYQQVQLPEGSTYDHERDGERLKKQRAAVFALMQDGQWRTLREIARETGAPEQSVSARLRDFRKPSGGGHLVPKRYVERGIWEYRLVVRQ